MSESSVRLSIALDTVLQRGKPVSATDKRINVDLTQAKEAIAEAKEDNFCDSDERDALLRFRHATKLTPDLSAAIDGALRLPRPPNPEAEARRRDQLRNGERVIKEGAATGTNEGTLVGGLLGTILILDAIFGK